jgi:hypothetical protein
MKERFIIIFVAIIAGLFITSAGFFIYQSTKKGNDAPIAKKTQVDNTKEPIPTDGSLYVRVSEPSDESLTAKRTLIVKGSTNPDNIIVVSTNLQDVEAKPNQDGEFSVSVDIDAGANELITRAIAPDGSSIQDIKTVTYSTDDF